MQKMFEHKQWIYFNEQTRKFEPIFLDPQVVARRFPKLNCDPGALPLRDSLAKRSFHRGSWRRPIGLRRLAA